MGKPLAWTSSQDATIRTMREDGATWAEIGASLGISRNTVIERGRRINAKQGRAITYVPDAPTRDPQPYPAGNPATWGLISTEAWPY